jgi:transcriptional regulator with XRE-family HTH domain
MSTSDLGAQRSDLILSPILAARMQPLAASPAAANTSAFNRPAKEFHRIREVRREQGVTLRRVAQLMHMDVEAVRREEEPTTDLPLSRLHAWQRLLDVPLADLLVDSDAPLSPPVLQRARLVRLMKTAASLVEQATTPRIRRLAETLATQLLEIMPELKGVTPWNSVGPRRQPGERERTIYSTRLVDHWRD